MWRLIVVTFGFLGVAFYQLSGGADYAPREGSRQHAALQGADARAPQRTSAPALASPKLERPVNGTARVVLVAAGSDDGADSKPVTRRRTPGSDEGRSAPGLDTVAADPDKIARLVSAARITSRTPEPAATAAHEPDQALRKVKSARVNMRAGPGTDYAVLDQLTRGTEVRIMQDEGDGWVRLRVIESGQEGWMADYLLVAAN